jgi:gamma-glutamyltranspeptidase
MPYLSAERMHLQSEAMKLAFADVYAHVADPAASPKAGDWKGDGTVYVAAADRS